MEATSANQTGIVSPHAAAQMVLFSPVGCRIHRQSTLARGFCFWHRLVFLAVTAITTCLIHIPNVVCGQGILISGVGEGAVIVLPGNVTTTNLAVTATPSSPAGPTNVIFVLERQGSVVVNRTSPPPYSITLSNLPTGKYFLSATLAAAGSPPKGDVSFDIGAAVVAPPNDNWNQAAALGLNTTATGFNTTATGENNEPLHAGSDVGKSIWWSWTAVSNGVFSATTMGSSFDTVLAVYTGTNVSSLTGVAANDDAGPNPFSQVTFLATNGTVYYFAVDGASASASGDAQLRLVAGSPPAISITSPVDGLLFLVGSPSEATNAPASAAISDPAGIARVDYWFDGGPGMSRSGILSSPYQLDLTNLVEGNYVLTLAAYNNEGLVSVSNAGLSVISLAPVLIVEGVVPPSPRFQISVTGFKGPSYGLLASTNLEVWCSVSTLTNFPGAAKVTDTNTAYFNRRFYRATSTP